MYKIIGADGKEYGPVTTEQLRRWITDGRVNAQTRVQTEGSADWKMACALPEFSDLLGGGTTSSTLAVSPLSLQDIAARDYSVDLGAWLSRGWNLVTKNAGLLIASTLLVMVVQGGISFIPQVGRVVIQIAHRNIALIAIGVVVMLVGYLIQLILSGPLKGGLYWPFLLRLRGQPAEVGDAFIGFRRGFVQLMLATIVTGLLAAACALPGLIVTMIGVFFLMPQHHIDQHIALAILIPGVILLIPGVLIAIYLSVCWGFTLPLVVDRQIGFWEAMSLSRQMVRKHWWGMFGSFFVIGLVAGAGVIACCVGLVFTIPVGLAAKMCAYEDIFGVKTTPTA
jgi:hypothetical protein